MDLRGWIVVGLTLCSAAPRPSTLAAEAPETRIPRESPALSGRSSLNPGADTCVAALPLGVVPPDAAESGIVLVANDEDWRTISLSSRRMLRVETIGDPIHADTHLSIYQGCDLAGYATPSVKWNGDRTPYDRTSSLVTPCLEPGTYWIQVSNFTGVDTSPFTLAVHDLGTCALPNQVLVRVYAVADVNGDRDGFPDTGETVDFSLEFANTSDVALTNLSARVLAGDSKLTCVTPGVVAVGNLAPGARVRIPNAVRATVSPLAERDGASVLCAGQQCSNFQRHWEPNFYVPACTANDQCRRTTSQEYSGSLEFRVTAAEFERALVSSASVELDLDSAHAPAATTTMVEGFESGFGWFTFDNLDANKATNALSAGYRCQATDPYRPGCGESGCDDACYLGFAAGQSPANAWHRHTSSAPDGGRAYLGAVSLHYGVHTPGNPGMDTYGLSQLDAMRTNVTFHLAARVCASDPSPDPQSCAVDADCAGAGGGPCVAAFPELSLAQQVSTMDWRGTNTPIGQSVDRAVLQARVAGGPWRTLRPFENVYDAAASSVFSNCTFDPIDDESVEWNLFPGADPNGQGEDRNGPSSTCFPEFSFNFIGDTDEPFAADRIGHASDGPGLPGSLGTGTWVRSRFDLSAFRGRAVNLRVVFTTIKIGDTPTVLSAFMVNPVPWDDGWYVDDVRVTQVLASASSATIDSAVPPPPASDPDGDGIDESCDNCAGVPNTSQRDLDQDGVGDPCDADADGDAVADGADCLPMNASLWSPPSAARELRVNGKSPTFLTWQPPAEAGGTGTFYAVARSDMPTSFLADQCVSYGGQAPQFEDQDPNPASGAGFYYLAISVNGCGSNAGTNSSGTPRSSGSCQ